MTVVVTGEHISKREWWDDGPVGGQHRSVALDQVIENRANESLQPILVFGMGGGDAVRGDYHASIDVFLQWLTPLGNPGAKTFQLEVR
ncbi:hypothetical protein ATY41_02845 [Leifsonia xyli subsp. xyli]|uniref:Uncharacterized protein n=1 Tax=Leifsonia xyli subsp. xyli TaxID=59736 RepID=A0A1E2SIA9_LEIXY|nr:hypothetical protein [Leifsonia xyli]ODA89493.1 hypothetical protein ATY41_05225 [Leifsonia xyli subsp. xyli]ODA89996.1 hypothetical protein ATY41_02845 [Leifsonia xyli subsp. xyli]